MAAKLKHKDSVAELYSTLSSLYEELVEKYEACIRQRRQVESNVHQCKKLLKPWPCWDNNQGDVAKEASDKQEKTSDEKDERQGDVAIDEQEKAKSNPDIELLDKILAKAQRAREIQEKIDAASTKGKLPRKSHSTQESTSKGKVIPKPTIKKDKAPIISNKQQRNPRTVAMVTRSTPTSQSSSTRPVVKQPVLERKNKPVPMKTTYGASFGKHLQSRPGTATGKKTGKDYLAGVLRDTSGKPRIAQDKTQHKNKNQASQLPVNKGVKKPTNMPNIEESQQSSSKDQTEDLEQKEPENHEEGQEEVAEDGDFVQRAKNELMRISNELKEVSLRKQERMKKEEMIEKNEEKPSCVPTSAIEPEPEVVQKKPFMLVEDGHTLCLPSKYRKIKSVNSKLVTKIHKKLHEPDFNLSARFTSHLENHFDWPNQSDQSDQSNQLSHETLSSEAEALMKSQCKLLMHANWVIDKSKVISTSTSSFSWQSVYKCYRHWQVLLGKFREVQKQVQDLMTAEGYLQRCCPCGGCLAARELSSHYSSTFNTKQDLWTERCCLFSTSLMADHEEAREHRDHVTYSSHKELRRLNEALHDLETKELNVQIQRRLGPAALQVLEHLDPSDRLFIPIYRGLWGLVCGQGKAFPSLVMDNTDD